LKKHDRAHDTRSIVAAIPRSSERYTSCWETRLGSISRRIGAPVHWSSWTALTRVADVTYNLVSVLYHALQGAETEEKHIRDAEQSGNQDLVQFFREVKDRNKQTAERAKQLLGAQLR
jgi:hypothetical protein